MPPAAVPAKDGVIREEKVEFRDQDGNILDEAQVKELEGKVSFSTRYETRTRYLDAQGKQVKEEVKDVKEQKAPHQPEVERVPGTKENPEGEGKSSSPAEAKVSPKGEEAEKDEAKKVPKPASEPQVATQSEKTK